MLDKFIASRPNGCSKQSIESYYYTLGKFVAYPITPEGINCYLSSLTCKNGKAKFYSCLRALSRWLYHNNYITENVIEKVSTPKLQKKLLPVVPREQLQVLMNHCHCQRDKALINFLWYSGMGLSEAVNVEVSDFNWEEGIIVVLGKGNRYRKYLCGNGLVKEWFQTHDSFEINKGWCSDYA